jgi:hypothetical protein
MSPRGKFRTQWCHSHLTNLEPTRLVLSIMEKSAKVVDNQHHIFCELFYDSFSIRVYTASNDRITDESYCGMSAESQNYEASRDSRC